MTTKKEVQEQIKELKKQIETINIIASIGDHEGIALIIDDLKENCVIAVKSDNFSKAEKQMKEIKTINNFIDYIEEKRELITEKEEEIKNLQHKLDNWQPGLFDNQ